MPLPLIGALLEAYNNLPAIPPTEPLGNLLNQLFALASGELSAFKQPVRLAADADLALSGLVNVDGVATVEGDRVLATAQNNAEENGIYIASAGAWVRSDDANADGEIIAGTFGIVEEGDTYADWAFLLITNNPIVVDTTTLDFKLINFNTLTPGGGSTALAGAISAPGDVSTNSFNNFVTVPNMSFVIPATGNHLVFFLSDVFADLSGASIQSALFVNNAEQTNTRREFTRGADNIRTQFATAGFFSANAGQTVQARWRKQNSPNPNAVRMGNRILLVLSVV
jgi:phage-related tail fiber protein